MGRGTFAMGGVYWSICDGYQAVGFFVVLCVQYAQNDEKPHRPLD